MGRNSRYPFLVCLHVFIFITAKHHSLQPGARFLAVLAFLLKQELSHFHRRDLGCFPARISVDPCADATERDTAPLLGAQLQTGSVAACQQFRGQIVSFAFRALVDGSDGVDDVVAGEIVGGGYFGGTGAAAVQAATFGHEGGAGGGVNCAVLKFGMLGLNYWQWGGAIEERTTPPPPRRDLFAAFTMEVTARVVIEP